MPVPYIKILLGHSSAQNAGAETLRTLPRTAGSKPTRLIVQWLARAPLRVFAVVSSASRKVPSPATHQYANICASLYTWTSPPLYVWNQPAVTGHYQFLIGGLYVILLFLGRRFSDLSPALLYALSFRARTRWLITRAIAPHRSARRQRQGRIP